jgi:hypothetical protein
MASPRPAPPRSRERALPPRQKRSNIRRTASGETAQTVGVRSCAPVTHPINSALIRRERHMAVLDPDEAVPLEGGDCLRVEHSGILRRR